MVNQRSLTQRVIQTEERSKKARHDRREIESRQDMKQAMRITYTVDEVGKLGKGNQIGIRQTKVGEAGNEGKVGNIRLVRFDYRVE